MLRSIVERKPGSARLTALASQSVPPRVATLEDSPFVRKSATIGCRLFAKWGVVLLE